MQAPQALTPMVLMLALYKTDELADSCGGQNMWTDGPADKSKKGQNNTGIQYCTMAKRLCRSKTLVSDAS